MRVTCLSLVLFASGCSLLLDSGDGLGDPNGPSEVDASTPRRGDGGPVVDGGSLPIDGAPDADTGLVSLTVVLPFPTTILQPVVEIHDDAGATLLICNAGPCPVYDTEPGTALELWAYPASEFSEWSLEGGCSTASLVSDRMLPVIVTDDCTATAKYEE